MTDPFGLRVVTVEYTQEPPPYAVPELRAIYAPKPEPAQLQPGSFGKPSTDSGFQTPLTGRRFTTVPVIRVFGTTEAGNHACLAVHGVFPYFFVDWPSALTQLYDSRVVKAQDGVLFPNPAADARLPGAAPLLKAYAAAMGPPFASTDAMLYTLGSYLDTALTPQRSSKAPAIYRIEVVYRRSIYGFEQHRRPFLKLSFLDRRHIPEAAALLSAGKWNGVIFQPFEVHLGGIHFFSDFNLRGMDYLWLRSNDLLPDLSTQPQASSNSHHAPVRVIADKVWACSADAILNQYETIVEPDKQLDALALSRVHWLRIGEGSVLHLGSPEPFGPRICGNDGTYIRDAQHTIDTYRNASPPQTFLCWNDPWPDSFDHPNAPPIRASLQGRFSQDFHHASCSRDTAIILGDATTTKNRPTSDEAIEPRAQGFLRKLLHRMHSAPTALYHEAPQAPLHTAQPTRTFFFSNPSDAPHHNLTKAVKGFQASQKSHTLLTTSYSAFFDDALSRIQPYRSRPAPRHTFPRLLAYGNPPPVLANHDKPSLPQGTTPLNIDITGRLVLSYQKRFSDEEAAPTLMGSNSPEVPSESPHMSYPQKSSSFSTRREIRRPQPSPKSAQRHLKRPRHRLREPACTRMTTKTTTVSTSFPRTSRRWAPPFSNSEANRKVTGFYAALRKEWHAKSSTFKPQSPPKTYVARQKLSLFPDPSNASKRTNQPVALCASEDTTRPESFLGRLLGIEVITDMAAIAKSIDTGLSHRQAKQHIPNYLTDPILAVVYRCVVYCDPASPAKELRGVEALKKYIPGTLWSADKAPEENSPHVTEIEGVVWVDPAFAQHPSNPQSDQQELENNMTVSSVQRLEPLQQLADTLPSWESVVLSPENVAYSMYAVHDSLNPNPLAVTQGGRESCHLQSTILQHIVPTELDLICWVMHRLFQIYDPTVVVGFDTAHSSIGYFVRRAEALGFTTIAAYLGRLPPHSPFTHCEYSTVNMSGPVSVTRPPDTVTRASGNVRLAGRIVLHVWRHLQEHIRTNQHSLHGIAASFYGITFPSFPRFTIRQWWWARTSIGLQQDNFSDSFSPTAAVDDTKCTEARRHSYPLRSRAILYVLRYLSLTFTLLLKSDFIVRHCETARFLGNDLWSSISRGSQYRIESLLTRTAHVLGYIMLTASKAQVRGQRAVAAIPLVLEPESNFYTSPVVVLDFKSLYPSIMIAYNMCYSTCIGRLNTLASLKEAAEKESSILPSFTCPLGVTAVDVDINGLKSHQKRLEKSTPTPRATTPSAVLVGADDTGFLHSTLRRGLIPSLLKEVIDYRTRITRLLTDLPVDTTEEVATQCRILGHRQFALKMFANHTYGYTSASYSGRMPCSELADAIVQTARRTLERTIQYIESHPSWRAKIVYGDTDSVFVLLQGRTLSDAFRVGREIVEEISALNPSPVELKLEKVYFPCCLQTKKRYVGYSYTSDTAVPYLDSKGIETIRRDQCHMVSSILFNALSTLFRTWDFSQMKAQLQESCKNSAYGEPWALTSQFIFLRDLKFGSYAFNRHQGAPAHTLPPQAVVAYNMMKDWKIKQEGPEAVSVQAFFEYSTRIPYIISAGPAGSRVIDLAVPPYRILNASLPLSPLSPVIPQIDVSTLKSWFEECPLSVHVRWYIRKQVAPVLHRLFSLCDDQEAIDVTRWCSATVSKPSLSLASLLKIATIRGHFNRYLSSKYADHPLFCLSATPTLTSYDQQFCLLTPVGSVASTLYPESPKPNIATPPPRTLYNAMCISPLSIEDSASDREEPNAIDMDSEGDNRVAQGRPLSTLLVSPASSRNTANSIAEFCSPSFFTPSPTSSKTRSPPPRTYIPPIEGPSHRIPTIQDALAQTKTSKFVSHPIQSIDGCDRQTIWQREVAYHDAEKRVARLRQLCVHCAGSLFAAEACHDAFYCPVYTLKIAARKELLRLCIETDTTNPDEVILHHRKFHI